MLLVVNSLGRSLLKTSGKQCERTKSPKEVEIVEVIRVDWQLT